MRLWALITIVVLPFAVSCSDPSPSPNGPTDAGTDAADANPSDCPAGILGDPSKPIEIELRTLSATGADIPIGEGGDLALIFPPQGGRVSFVGVRARNLDGCAVQLTAAIRDPATGQLQLDARTQNLQRDADGWGTSGRGTTTQLEDATALGDYANVPICPNQWASTAIFDRTFELEVKVQERNKRSATKTIRVTPRCAEPGAKETACRCLCKEGYRLGEACGETVDGGTL